MAETLVAEDVKGKPAEKPAAPAPTPSAPAAPAPKPAGETPAPEPPATPPVDPERKDGAPSEPPKPPERYDLRVPVGSRVDREDLAFVERMAKTAGWSHEDAQAAVDEIHSLFDAQAQRYVEEARADRDYGGDQFELTDRRARLVIDRVRPQGHPRRDAFLAFLNKGGSYNNIEVLSFLADLGKGLGEDSPARGSAASGETRSLAERLYPNQPA